jgi:hypothetical protein
VWHHDLGVFQRTGTYIHIVTTLHKTNQRAKCRRKAWDHQHHQEKIMPYEYESAAQLLEDFWNEVELFIDGGNK